MAANTAPIFGRVGNIGRATITAANTTKDGASGTVSTVFTAGADGSYVFRIRGMPLGTNVASVARVFLNNGGANTTASNNSMFDNINLPATTNSETVGLSPVEIGLNFRMKAGETIFMTLGTAVSAGWAFTCVGEDY